MKKVKLQINHDIIDLNEGRKNGLAFGFVKKLKTGSFETVMPISTCKDYLNDVCISEKYNKAFGKIHGFSYKPSGIFKGNKSPYLAVQFKKYSNITSDNNKARRIKEQEGIKLLKDNSLTMIKFMNMVEEKFGAKKSEVFIDNNTIIIKLSKKFVSDSYKISMWTSLFRMALEFKEVPKSLNTEDIVFPNYRYYGAEAMYKKVLKIMEKGFFKSNITKDTSIILIHSCGIIGVKIPA